MSDRLGYREPDGAQHSAKRATGEIKSLEETNHFRIVGWLVYSLLLVYVYTRMTLKGFLNYCCVA